MFTLNHSTKRHNYTALNVGVSGHSRNRREEANAFAGGG